MDVNRIREFCISRRYSFKQFGRAPRSVLVGEEHCNGRHSGDQRRLIEMIRPKVVVHESYHKEDRAKQPRVDKKRENPFLYKLQELERLAKEYGFEIQEGDTSSESWTWLSSRLDSILAQFDEWPLELRGRKYGDAFPSSHEDMSYARYFARIIAEPIMGLKLHDQMLPSNFPVMGFYGAYHLRPGSQIHSVLRLSFPPLSRPNPHFLSGVRPLIKQDYVVILQDKHAKKEGWIW